MFTFGKINTIFPLFLLACLLVSVPMVSSKALPQNDDAPAQTTIAMSENEIPNEPPASSPETPAPTKRPNKNKNTDDFLIISDLKNDYDMFLDYVNQTAQVKLSLFEQTMAAVEKELRPGTPLMKLVDWVLSLFQSSQGSQNKTPSTTTESSDSSSTSTSSSSTENLP